MSSMLTVSQPGSNAAKYAVAQSALVSAERDAGQPQPAQPETATAESIQLCATPSTAPNGCTTYQGFVVDPKTGKLVDFTVNGKSLTGRIVIGAGSPVQAAGSKVKLVSAYRSVQADALFVIVEVAAGSQPVNAFTYSAVYVAPDGRQVSADGSNSAGPSGEIQPGAKADLILGFPSVDVGGRLTLQLADPSYNASTVTLPVQ